LRTAFSLIAAAEDAGFDTCDGVNPIRFPDPQTEVHAGLHFSVYACEAIAQTLATAPHELLAQRIDDPGRGRSRFVPGRI